MAPPKVEQLDIRLPGGFRAREFDDADRDVLVEQRNAEVHPMEQGSADEWRQWEKIAPDVEELRIIVEDAGGRVAAFANIGPGGAIQMPDGALGGGVGVRRDARGRGLGTALVEAIEGHARARGAPRILGNASAAMPWAVEFALKRGYMEIGRRIESFIDLASFDPPRFADALERPRREGIEFTTIAALLEARGEGEREQVWRELYEAEAPCWEDVPWATPVPHWSYETFKKMMADNPRAAPDLSVLALHDGKIVGMTTTGRRRDRDGQTWMTGTAREHRGRGIARALKVEALTRGKAAGMRAFMTTNDEPNKAMRGINAALGYEMLPASVELEKKLN